MVRAAIAILFACGAADAATTVWAGTAAGVYKSVDSGSTWQVVPVNVSDPLLRGTNPQTANVDAMALDPQQPATVYFVGNMAGSNGIGFYRSTDNGKTWTSTAMIGYSVGSPIVFQTAWILVDPVLTNVIYLGHNSGVAKSMDYGATWTRLTLPAPPGSSTPVGTPDGLSIDPNTSGVLYFTGQVRVYRSADYGATWAPASLVVANSIGVRLGNVIVDERNSSVLYLGNSGGGAPACPVPGVTGRTQSCGLFRSTDAGVTWTNIAQPGQYGDVVFDSRTTDMYAPAGVSGLGPGIVKSTDGGLTWNAISNKARPILISDPSASGSFFGYIWNDGAWYKSADGALTFTTAFLPIPGNSRDIHQLVTPRTLGNVSAASFQSGPVAPESIVSALGFGLATADTAATTVTVIDAAGVARPATVFYASAGQVNYEIPAGTAPGVAKVLIKAGDGLVRTAPLGIAAVAPALFTLNAGGLVAAYALRVSGGGQSYENVYQVDASNNVVARPIDLGPAGDQVYLLLYGTGLRGASDVAVTIGGDNVPVFYAGAQGQYAGEDQVNIGPLPRDLAGKGSVPLVLTAGGKTANATNVTIR
jgi:uncharacterized protein (TIGR03437 family)